MFLHFICCTAFCSLIFSDVLMYLQRASIPTSGSYISFYSFLVSVVPYSGASQSADIIPEFWWNHENAILFGRCTRTLTKTLQAPVTWSILEAFQSANKSFNLWLIARKHPRPTCLSFLSPVLVYLNDLQLCEIYSFPDRKSPTSC